jgi:hypothetical protein
MSPRKRLFTTRPGRRAHLRAIIGLRLRRALRPKDLRTRIAVLSRDLDARVTRRLKHLTCGLTRLYPLHTQPERRAAVARADAPIAPTLFPDSS